MASAAAAFIGAKAHGLWNTIENNSLSSCGRSPRLDEPPGVWAPVTFRELRRPWKRKRQGRRAAGERCAHSRRRGPTPVSLELPPRPRDGPGRRAHQGRLGSTRRWCEILPVSSGGSVRRGETIVKLLTGRRITNHPHAVSEGGPAIDLGLRQLGFAQATAGTPASWPRAQRCQSSPGVRWHHSRATWRVPASSARRTRWCNASVAASRTGSRCYHVGRRRARAQPHQAGHVVPLRPLVEPSREARTTDARTTSWNRRFGPYYMEGCGVGT